MSADSKEQKLPFRDRLKKTGQENYYAMKLAKLSGTDRAWFAVGTLVSFVVSSVSVKKQQRMFLETVHREYFAEIAKHYGVSERQITRKDVEDLYQQNPILKEVIEVSKVRPTTRIAELVASGISGFFLGGMAAKSLIGIPEEYRGEKVEKDKKGQPINLGEAKDLLYKKEKPLKNLKGKILKELPDLIQEKPEADTKMTSSGSARIGGLLITALSGFMVGSRVRNALHKGFRPEALEQTAHAKIMKMVKNQNEGIPVSPVEIFEVQLAIRPELKERVGEVRGAAFSRLSPDEKLDFLKSELPDVYEADRVMAERVNVQGARPQGLFLGIIDEVAPKDRSLSEATRQQLVEAKAREKETAHTQEHNRNPEIPSDDLFAGERQAKIHDLNTQTTQTKTSHASRIGSNPAATHMERAVRPASDLVVTR